jgi:hypothetical protein
MSTSPVKNLFEEAEAVLPRATEGFPKALWNLARRLKAHGDRPEAFAYVVEHWLKKAAKIIGEVSLESVWEKFMAAWDRVNEPHGEKIKRLGVQSRSGDLPPEAAMVDRKTEKEMVALCYLLQQEAGHHNFFLDYRSAGLALGVSREIAGMILKLLCKKGVLLLVEPGKRWQATRYRYVSQPKSDEWTVSEE